MKFDKIIIDDKSKEHEISAMKRQEINTLKIYAIYNMMTMLWCCAMAVNVSDIGMVKCLE